MAPLALGLMFFSCFFRSDWTNFLFKGLLGASHHLSLLLLGFFFTAFILNVLLYQDRFKTYRFLGLMDYKTINWIFFLLASALIVIAWRITSIYSADHSFRSVHHLDAILYSLSQVVQGKTILVDLPSQYGLFPELIAPIFKVIGLSVFKFSTLMAVLELIALVAVFYVLVKLVKSQLLVFLGGITLIVLTGENELYFAGFPDPYYQYWPIRFFCPAISLFLFYWFCKRKSLTKSVIISLASSVSVIWNSDTGLFIFISYGIYLGTRYLFSLLGYTGWSKNRFIIALILHFILLIATLFSFGLFLKISSGQSLNYSWLFSYYSVFYKVGYGMMPMPLHPHPWMLILVVYFYGLVFSLSSFKQFPTYKSELIFYLSVLGIGLFTYYQGRSHVANLFKVMWPAILISLFFAEQAIRSIKLKLTHPVNLIFPTVITTLLLLCSTVFLANGFTMFSDLSQQWQKRYTFQNPLIGSELQFIKENTYRGQACWLLIKNQASYYAESGLVSPIKGPGLVETMLKSDVAYMTNQVLEKKPACILLGRNESEFNPGFNFDELFKNYVLVKQNRENTIHLLRPKYLSTNSPKG